MFAYLNKFIEKKKRIYRKRIPYGMQNFEEASAQISRYADSDTVRESVKTTKLHKLVVVYRGAEMAACEEI